MKRGTMIALSVITALTLLGCAVPTQQATTETNMTSSFSTSTGGTNCVQLATKKKGKKTAIGTSMIAGEISALSDGVVTLKLISQPQGGNPGGNGGLQQNGRGKGTQSSMTPRATPIPGSTPLPRPSHDSNSTPPPRPSGAGSMNTPTLTYTGEVKAIDLNSAAIYLRSEGKAGAGTETKISVSSLTTGMILEIVYASDGTTITKVVARKAFTTVNS